VERLSQNGTRGSDTIRTGGSMSDRKPPLARDLSSVRAGYTRTESGGPADDRPGAAEALTAENADQELVQLRGRVATLTDALEDVVALALSGADYKERAIMMHRRAVAALSGLSVTRPGDAQPGRPD
jgi:hypothetical protein